MGLLNNVVPFTLLVALGGPVICLIFAALGASRHDRREPPLAPQSIPLIGHIIGLSRRTFHYYVDLSERLGVPAFTVPLPGQKMYVIADADLVLQVQKQFKTLSFLPIAAGFAARLCGISERANAIIMKNVDGEDGDWSLATDAHTETPSALRPSESLDDMNRIMLREVQSALEDLQPVKGEVKRMGLYVWLQHAITIATTRSVYGPKNPYDDRELEDAFWTFERGVMAIVIGILPSITAREPVAAREKIVARLVEYYKSGAHEQASALERVRVGLGKKYDLPLEDIARFEMGNSLAIMVNTGPATLWALIAIHAHPGLRNQIREEVDACTMTSVEEDGQPKRHIDLARLRESCPLLLSTWQETIRCNSMGTSVRLVKEDTYLEGMLLKKGAMLQMPSRTIHSSSTLWGSSAAEFNPRRFLPSEKKHRPGDKYFRGFGGGKHLCPGRHFATNEGLAMVAAFVARLDMDPVGGEWVLPTTDNTSAATTILEPDHDVDVEIRVRKGMENTRWDLGLGGKGSAFSLFTEEQD